MATSLASLSVIIGANLQPLERDLRRARTITSQNVKAMQSMSVNAFVPSGGIKNQWATAMGGPMYRSMPSAVGFNTRAYQQAMNNAMWARQFQPSASQQWMEATGGKPYVAPIPKPPKLPRKSGGGRGFGMGGFGMLGGVGGMMRAMGLTSVAAGFGMAIREGEKFNQVMMQSTAIMGNLSSDMKNKLAKAAIDSSRTVKYSATESANALFFLASAGLKAEQSLGAIGKVTKFAQSGNMNLTEAARLATQTTAAFGLKANNASVYIENLGRVTDVLAYTNTRCQSTVEQLARAMANKGAARARFLGKSVEETAAVLSVYADQGKLAEEAGTYLDMSWRELGIKAIQNKQAFADLGIKVYDTSGKMRHTADIIRDMENAFQGLSTEQATERLMSLGLPARSLVALMPLLGYSNKIMEQHADILAKAGGYAEKLAAEQLTPLQKAWADFSATVTESASSIMTTFYPVITEVLKSFGDVIESVSLAGESVRVFSEMLGGLKLNPRFVETLKSVWSPLRMLGKLIDAAKNGLASIEEQSFYKTNEKAKALIAELKTMDPNNDVGQGAIMENLKTLLGKSTFESLLPSLLDELPDKLRKKYESQIPKKEETKASGDYGGLTTAVSQLSPEEEEEQQKAKEKFWDKFWTDASDKLTTPQQRLEQYRQTLLEVLRAGGLSREQGEKLFEVKRNELFPELEKNKKEVENLAFELHAMRQGWDEATIAARDYFRATGDAKGADAKWYQMQQLELEQKKQDAQKQVNDWKSENDIRRNKTSEELVAFRELQKTTQDPTTLLAGAQELLDMLDLRKKENQGGITTGFTDMASWGTELQNALMGKDKEKLDKDRNQLLKEIKTLQTKLLEKADKPHLAVAGK
jgi:TP901 family phage tail tape measure protein